MADVHDPDRAAREALKQEKRDAIAGLCESAQNCQACDLGKTRMKVVFGVGNAASPLMLIGEGPGANEDAQGEPFVGRAGKLLDECLFQAGMKREHIYLTNIVKCRAFSEENGRIVNRQPLPAELDACVPTWLRKQLQIVQPRVICCIGAPSAKVIVGSGFAIMRDRGKFFPCNYAPHAIAVIHPAFILRQEGEEYQRNRRYLIEDLIAAKERAIASKNEPRQSLF